MGHRNSEWCGHGPVLEQDIAITNISLDLIGQSRNFYQYAAELINTKTGSSTGSGKATEDTIAYLRDSREFRNCLITELPKGDWAFTVLRQFFFSTYQYFLYNMLRSSDDPQLAAIAEKSLKEVMYHEKWSREWVIRLGDGTEESHRRMENAINGLWPFTGEMFIPASYEQEAVAAGTVPDVSNLKDHWMKKIETVFGEATLPVPDEHAWMQKGGKDGSHTEYLGFILAEMQFLQRAYPDCAW
jgi:ring-1,2-phenylacetyl-CoA epoxidase subunit PaaC